MNLGPLLPPEVWPAEIQRLIAHHREVDRRPHPSRHYRGSAEDITIDGVELHVTGHGAQRILR